MAAIHEPVPYVIEYADLDALIDALEIAVEKTNDLDQRRLLLGALINRRNNNLAITASTEGALDHATVADFINERVDA